MTPTDEGNDQLAAQKEFVEKVKKLSSNLIEYKRTRDELNQNYEQAISLKANSKRYYNLIVSLKDDVLEYGKSLNFSNEMVIQMVIDMTRSQLSDWYVRKLFSGDFNRGILLKNSENSENSVNDGKKDTVESSSTVSLPMKSNDEKVSITPLAANPNFQYGKEVQTIELDLKQALEKGLKEHILKCENSKSASYILKLFVEDGLLKRIEKNDWFY